MAEKELKEQIKESAKAKIKEAVINFVDTGITLLNLIFGGGAPTGRIINIIGHESAGKTLLALEILASFKKIFGEKLKDYYDDCESGFNFDPEVMYNMKIEQRNSSETVEELEYNITKQLESLKKDEYLVYVVDSLDGLSSIEEKEVIL